MEMILDLQGNYWGKCLNNKRGGSWRNGGREQPDAGKVRCRLYPGKEEWVGGKRLSLARLSHSCPLGEPTSHLILQQWTGISTPATLSPWLGAACRKCGRGPMHFHGSQVNKLGLSITVWIDLVDITLGEKQVVSENNHLCKIQNEEGGTNRERSSTYIHYCVN